MSFFQSAGYYQLMEGLKGCEPFVYQEIFPSGNQSQCLTGIRYVNPGIVKQHFTSRILVICDPQTDFQVNYPISFVTDWQFRQHLHKKSIYTELRLLGPPPENTFLHSLPYSNYSPYQNILIDTSHNAEFLFSNLSATKKRQVQASLKAGAFVRQAQSEDEVETFYLILKDLYKNKIRKPLISKEVFARIFRNTDLGKIFIVFHHKRIVGGMLCPVFEKAEIYEWYIAGLDEDMKQNKIFPSVLVTWEVLKYASENGFQRFNFMGAGEKGKKYGVRDFKLQFGGKLVDAPRYIFVHNPLLYQLGKTAIKLGMGK